MEGNPYGRESVLRAVSDLHGGETKLENVYCTAPFKLLPPLPLRDGGAAVTQLSVSAGLLAGDRQQIDLRMGAGTYVRWTFQSYEKLHRMPPGFRAERNCRVAVEPGALLDYRPQPVIPHAGSDFRGRTRITLRDKSARLIYGDILCCGRVAMGERFKFRRYRNLVEITCGGRLIYRDNTDLRPEQSVPEGLGMFEGHTHAASLILCNTEYDILHIRNLLEKQCQGGRFLFAVTALNSKDMVVRMLGYSAQELESAINSIVIRNIRSCQDAHNVR